MSDSVSVCEGTSVIVCLSVFVCKRMSVRRVYLYKCVFESVCTSVVLRVCVQVCFESVCTGVFLRVCVQVF